MNADRDGLNASRPLSGYFLDGTGVTPGSEGCKCGGECEFPCWQRLGVAPACDECGCEVDTGYAPPGRQIGSWHFQRNAWGGVWVTWKRGPDYKTWICWTLWRPHFWKVDRG